MLARLPVAVGDPIYHGLQNLRGGLEPRVGLHLDFVAKVLAERAKLGAANLTGLEVVELGSGWAPVTPLVLVCRGARSVHTYDINRHYSRKRIREAATALQPKLEDRDGRLAACARTGVLPAAIHYHAQVDLAAQGPAVPADLAVSRFVLEHVPPEDIVRIHRSALEWMAPGGMWAHWVSPGDHRSYSDASLSAVDFLRYSPEEWQRIAGNRFAYHNRLRLPHYRQLFEKAGWKVAHEESSALSAHLESIKRVPVHADFAGFAPEELVAGSLWFFLTRS